MATATTTTTCTFQLTRGPRVGKPCGRKNCKRHMNKKQSISEGTIAQLENDYRNDGIVFYNCGCPDLDKFYQGFLKLLCEKGQAEEACFNTPYYLTVDNRVDLVIPFSGKGQIDIGRFSTWRIRLGAAWISDYYDRLFSDSDSEWDYSSDWDSSDDSDY